MSIEAMKRIKSLLQDTKMIDSHTISAVVAECDMAILAQQPTKGEPVYQICKKDSHCISSAWIDVEKRAYEDAGMYPEYGRRTLYTHPAPSVPADVVRDAERYRFILAAADDMTTSRYKSMCELLGVAITEDFDLGAAIDAAMLAAKDASA